MTAGLLNLGNPLVDAAHARYQQLKKSGMNDQQIFALMDQEKTMVPMGQLAAKVMALKNAAQNQAKPPPQGTINDQVDQRLSAGLGSVPVDNVGNESAYASGGIVAFDEGGDIQAQYLAQQQQQMLANNAMQQAQARQQQAQQSFNQLIDPTQGTYAAAHGGPVRHYDIGGQIDPFQQNADIGQDDSFSAYLRRSQPAILQAAAANQNPPPAASTNQAPSTDIPAEHVKIDPKPPAGTINEENNYVKNFLNKDFSAQSIDYYVDTAKKQMDKFGVNDAYNNLSKKLDTQEANIKDNYDYDRKMALAQFGFNIAMHGTPAAGGLLGGIAAGGAGYAQQMMGLRAAQAQAQQNVDNSRFQIAKGLADNNLTAVRDGIMEFRDATKDDIGMAHNQAILAAGMMHNQTIEDIERQKLGVQQSEAEANRAWKEKYGEAYLNHLYDRDNTAKIQDMLKTLSGNSDVAAAFNAWTRTGDQQKAAKYEAILSKAGIDPYQVAEYRRRLGQGLGSAQNVTPTQANNSALPGLTGVTGQPGLNVFKFDANGNPSQ